MSMTDGTDNHPTPDTPDTPTPQGPQDELAAWWVDRLALIEATCPEWCSEDHSQSQEMDTHDFLCGEVDAPATHRYAIGEVPDGASVEFWAAIGLDGSLRESGYLFDTLTCDTPEDVTVVADWCRRAAEFGKTVIDSMSGPGRSRDWAPEPCPSWCEHGALHSGGPREHCAGFPEVGDCDLLVGVIEHEDGTLTDLVVDEGDFEIPTPGPSPVEQVEWLNRRIRTYARALVVVEDILATGRLAYPYTWPQDEV